MLNFLKTSFACQKVIKLWISIVAYHCREGKMLASKLARCGGRVWRKYNVRAQLGRSGVAVGKVQLGRAEEGSRPCDCWELCSWWLGHWPLQSFHSRYLSEAQTCSSITAGSPVVSVPQFPDPGHLPQWLPEATVLTGAPWQCPSPCLCIDRAVFKTWMTAQECQMYSWSRNRIEKGEAWLPLLYC